MTGDCLYSYLTLAQGFLCCFSAFSIVGLVESLWIVLFSMYKTWLFCRIFIPRKKKKKRFQKTSQNCRVVLSSYSAESCLCGQWYQILNSGQQWEIQDKKMYSLNKISDTWLTHWWEEKFPFCKIKNMKVANCIQRHWVELKMLQLVNNLRTLNLRTEPRDSPHTAFMTLLSQCAQRTVSNSFSNGLSPFQKAHTGSQKKKAKGQLKRSADTQKSRTYELSRGLCITCERRFPATDKTVELSTLEALDLFWFLLYHG